jgi:uncharacterized membrane protein
MAKVCTRLTDLSLICAIYRLFILMHFNPFMVLSSHFILAYIHLNGSTQFGVALKKK